MVAFNMEGIIVESMRFRSVCPFSLRTQKNILQSRLFVAEAEYMTM